VVDTRPLPTTYRPRKLWHAVQLPHACWPPLALLCLQPEVEQVIRTVAQISCCSDSESVFAPDTDKHQTYHDFRVRGQGQKQPTRVFVVDVRVACIDRAKNKKPPANENLSCAIEQSGKWLSVGLLHV